MQKICVGNVICRVKGNWYIQNAQIEILQLFVFKKTKTASFTRVLYFGSTGHKNCDSTERHVIDKLTLLYPILKLALKVAYFIKHLGICRRMSFTCSSCESFERERDFRRWMLVSGEGGKIEGGSFPSCFLLSNLDIKSRKGFLVPSSPELFLAAAAALQNWSWELSPPLLRPTPPPSLGFRAAPGWAVQGQLAAPLTVAHRCSAARDWRVFFGELSFNGHPD